MRITSSLIVLSLLSACPTTEPDGDDDDITPGVDAAQSDDPDWFPAAQTMPTPINRDIDILFVIDDSASMNEEQVSLGQNFYRFIHVLQGIEGGMPNVHLGVVSSNVGIGSYTIAGCSGDGDGGRLQNSASIPGCTPPQGYYIIDEQAGTGRNVNYSGELDETFACIAQLGTSGCGFEQHLESMEMALDPVAMPSTNAGFIRPDAWLALIIIADEDDCSASNPALFDTSQQDMGDVVGPLTSFRCTEFGVTCGGAPVARAPATYGVCEPRADELYMRHPQYYADFLKSLKDDPRNILVAGIFGDPTPFEVTTDIDGFPQLEASCQTTMGDAAPGVRLKYFLDQFPDRNAFASICQGDLSEALAIVASELRKAVEGACLEGDVVVADADPEAPGLQISCQVALVTSPGTAAEDWTLIPACVMQDELTIAPDSPRPCWTISLDTAGCPTTPTHLEVAVQTDTTPPAGSQVAVACAGQNL